MSWERELVLEVVPEGGGSPASMDVIGGVGHDSMVILDIRCCNFEYTNCVEGVGISR